MTFFSFVSGRHQTYEVNADPDSSGIELQRSTKEGITLTSNNVEIKPFKSTYYYDNQAYHIDLKTSTRSSVRGAKSFALVNGSLTQASDDAESSVDSQDNPNVNITDDASGGSSANSPVLDSTKMRAASVNYSSQL